ncbi:MAG: extracellular solute-binding protein [Anaerolineae bacterium]|nr:extracellular solute-binding protein [Anaerolineae bacterium]
MKRVLWMSIAVLLAALVALSACGTPTPETITIIETVEKVVEKEGETVTIIETKETIVTATPEPTASPYDENAPIEVWVDAARMPEVEAWREAHPDKSDLVNVTQADRGGFANQILLFNNIGEGWPDVIFGEPNLAAQWSDAAHDYTADLTPWIPQEIIDNYGDNLSQCYYAGKLVCLRHDLAQMMLWYDQVVLDELGVGIPDTWEEYRDIALQIAAEHPGEGYVVGTVATSEQWLFTASMCPMVHEIDLGHVEIFKADDPNCIRAAELLDELWEAGVLLASPYGGEIVEGFGSKVAFVPHASWYGQHVILPNYPEELKTAGRIGAALLPKWSDQEVRWTGAWGGSAWEMSKHTKNPQLASEVIIWLATGPWNETDATTFPAYPPANKVWGEQLATDPFYVENPFPNMEEMAPLIWTGVSTGRMLSSMRGAFTELVNNPMIAGERTTVESLPIFRERLLELAGPQGFEVVNP